MKSALSDKELSEKDIEKKIESSLNRIISSPRNDERLVNINPLSQFVYNDSHTQSMKKIQEIITKYGKNTVSGYERSSEIEKLTFKA